MSEQLSAAAAAMGVPEPIVERSARAWADASGQSYEDVIAAWAGGEAVASAPPAAEAAPATEPEAAATEEAAPEAAAPEPATAPAQPAAEPAAAAAAVAPPPAPERVSPEEALEHPVVVTVPTAGITERTGYSIPMWLGALLLIVPAFGLIYLAMGSGAAECGAGTALRVDRVTGEAINCDGTPFEGRGAAGGGADFIAMGEETYATCAGCHGPQGQGSGSFPALTAVTSTFAACTDHIEWVELGSAGFTAAGRNTYGDTNQAVDGGMPGFGGSLSPEQLAAVVAFERVRFGGGNPDEVLADCGLAEGEEGGEGEEGEDGEATDETTDGTGAEETTDTTGGAEAAVGRSG